MDIALKTYVGDHRKYPPHDDLPADFLAQSGASFSVSGQNHPVNSHYLVAFQLVTMEESQAAGYVNWEDDPRNWVSPFYKNYLAEKGVLYCPSSYYAKIGYDIIWGCRKPTYFYFGNFIGVGTWINLREQRRMPKSISDKSDWPLMADQCSDWTRFSPDYMNTPSGIRVNHTDGYNLNPDGKGANQLSNGGAVVWHDLEYYYLIDNDYSRDAQYRGGHNIHYCRFQ